MFEMNIGASKPRYIGLRISILVLYILLHVPCILMLWREARRKLNNTDVGDTIILRLAWSGTLVMIFT